jgi:hypothetical protein
LQVSSSLPKGDLNSELALNYRVKLVQHTSTPTAEQPAVPIASLRSSYFTKSNDMLISVEAVSSQTPKRLSNSGRKTKRLKNKCLVDLHRKLVPHSKDGPRVYDGEPHHYNGFGCWSHDGFIVTKSGTDAAGSPSGDVAHLPDKPKLLSSVVEANESCAHQGPLAPPLPFDFTKYTYAKRTSNKSHWPLPNTKSISSKKSLGEMMTGSHGSKILASHGIIPVVASPNPQDKTNSIHVPFGPPLDVSHQPVPAGQCFPESHLHRKYRLKAGKEFNDECVAG